MKELNILLADIAVARQKGYNLHWNIKGDDFLAFHKMLESYYEELSELFDAVAEKIAMSGSVPASTLKEYLELATIKEIQSKNYSTCELVEIWAGDIKLLMKSVDKIEVTKYTTSLVDDLNDYLQKQLWIVESHKCTCRECNKECK